MGQMKRIQFGGVVLCAVLALSLSTARADSFSICLNLEFSGAFPPAGPPSPCWLEATFVDVGLNSVDLTLEGHLVGSAEFVGEWLFNLDPTKDPNQLSITYSSGVPNNTAVISTGVDAFQANGDGLFDIQFDWPNNPVGDRFNDSDVVVYNITSTQSINVHSFNYESAPDGGNSEWLSAAHVQGIGDTGANSGWIAPEPASLALLAFGSLGLLRRRR
jgi:hypothetical protein